ncbi:unnamed protein product [Caenorhabditis auriculariae]|uniref:Purple acid phosphatase n=1 Tax=Caenorhabditis auriculariae TaxID=2777116 RepID=A0A8S1HRX1_9PELO|nr:unnamed protein product [Caenorhabditis auriculariae]
MLPFWLLACFLAQSWAAPEQVHLAFHDGPLDLSVAWITFNDVDSILSYGTSLSSLVKKTGDIKKWVFGGITRYSHRVRLHDLKPSTQYYYQIESRIFHFKTLPANPKSYKVCIYGDLGIENGVSTTSIINQGLAGQFDFVVHVGDLAYDLHTDNGKRGDKFMNLMEPLISTMPYMVIAGNHEDDGKNFSNYQTRFYMPHNGYGDNQFYSVDIGPVHWLGISTEFYGFDREYGTASIQTQYNWLQNDLKTAEANRKNVPWISTFQHRPMYCSIEYGNECTDFTSDFIRVGDRGLPGLEPTFLKYSIDFGFWGHMHAYERMYPVADRKYYASNSAYHNPVAPVYVLTGSAGCHTPGAKFSNKPTAWSAFRSDDYGYTIMTVANMTHVRLQQVSVSKNGAFIDDIWVSKDPGHIHTATMRENTPHGEIPNKSRYLLENNEIH